MVLMYLTALYQANNAYIGDNAYIENCIVESNSTIKANSRYVGENGVKIVIEDSPSYY